MNHFNKLLNFIIVCFKMSLTEHVGLLHGIALYIYAGTQCMGKLTGHHGQRLACQSQCENFLLAILIAVPWTSTVEPRYNEVLGTMKITLLYQVSHYIRVKKLRNIKGWDKQNFLVITGFCYIRPLYNEVPLY